MVYFSGAFLELVISNVAIAPTKVDAAPKRTQKAMRVNCEVICMFAWGLG